jgi:hypothetical protein
VLPLLLEGRRGYPISIPPQVPGETLGPIRWSGQQRHVNVASLLEGTALVLGDPECLQRGGTILEGAMVEGFYCFVDLPLDSFVSFRSVWHVCALVQRFFFCLVELLYGMVALFIKRDENLFQEYRR